MTQLGDRHLNMASGLKFSESEIDAYREAFMFFDRDKDEKIDAAELANVMRTLGMNPTPAELEDMVREVDIDGNGTIEFDEFLELLAKHTGSMDPEAELREAFNMFDKDGNGMIDKEELTEMLMKLGETLTPADLEELMRQADTNQDGMIDFQEFKALVGTK